MAPNASDLQHLGRGPVPNISSTSSERRRLWALACAGLTMLRVPAQSSGLGGLGVTKLRNSQAVGYAARAFMI